MNEERIDIDSLFDLQDDLPAPKQPPKKRTFPKGVIVMVLAVLLLAGGFLAYDWFSDRASPDEKGFFDYTILREEPKYVQDFLPGQKHPYRITDGETIWYLDDYAFAEGRLINFWILIDPTATGIDENWQFTAVCNYICTASGHADQSTPVITAAKKYLGDEDFAGWLVYGYTPRSTELQLLLHDSNGSQRNSQVLVVDPVVGDGADTATLLDYAVHLEDMLDLLAISNTEAIYSGYIGLASRHPALKELISRGDLPQAVAQYLSSDATTCKTMASLVSSVYFRHLTEVKDYGTYLLPHEMVLMTTQELVFYLNYHHGFQNYMNYIGTADKVNLQQRYAAAKEFCPVLSVLESRSDAAKIMIPLCGEEIVPRFLLSQPQFRAQMTLEDAEQYLLTCYSSPTLFSVQTNILAEVTVSLGEVCGLAAAGTLGETVEQSAVLTALTQRSEAAKFLCIQLQSATATRAQKVSATALLELPVLAQQMTDEERSVFEQHKTYPNELLEYDPPTSQLVDLMLQDRTLVLSPLASSNLDMEVWYRQAKSIYPILSQLEAREDAVSVLREKQQEMIAVSSKIADSAFLLTLLSLSAYGGPPGATEAG